MKLGSRQYLIDHGIEVFGTKENFESWLQRENFFFDKKGPPPNLCTQLRALNLLMTG